MSKTFFGNAEILHNTPYEAISVLVDKTTTGTVVENGRKVLKAGAILSGDGASIFEDRTKKVKVEANATEATYVDGILLYDVDVTDKDAVATLVYRGTLREDKVNGGTVDANVKAKLPHIQFVKGA
ncbi:hypothetical protein MK525_03305 [Streptococcus gallolyticus subsp. gallolyticus]|uniref:hypothetical protein n=1 Tax=Streptococcus gallolyticus TaxID=315405 RepID=UPI00208E68FB|nr:hypothetical protein [Streptococcus gallolyticus]MCO4605159.1 hypothetical protein [Streptococcus infantarius subsp. infantarius]MCO4638354.1 hypothetical protein [Streptococcus infantarius subsp. infantarius]MCO4641660.1 hypothetical protein [Streptococcus infantarius subsp. infantarius]MCO4643449.1 hypothetical protein [Streptococcus infantarius subsp. infantarius]MCY7157512.1 hypothetical protein [Streptococcus gallolyticus subsp. gallolyticus]